MDKRIGKKVRGPNPKCPACKNYLRKTSSIIDSSVCFWHCMNCDSQYERK